MPKYTINGKVYRSDTPLSDDDLEELASGAGAPAPVEAPKPERSFADKAMNVVDAVRRGGSKEDGSFNEEARKDLIDATGMPMRGFRGAGVAAQRAIEGDSLAASLQRGAAATEVGYVPKDGEKVGDFLGNMADPRYIPIAGLKAAKGAGMVGKAGIAALQGASAGAGSSALNQFERKGEVDGAEVAGSAAVGGALGPIATGLFKAPGAILKGAKNASPKIAEAVGNLKEYLGRGVSENPKLLNLEGSPDSVGRGVRKIQDVLVKAKASAGAKMQAEKESLGIAETLSNKANRRIRDGKPSVDDVMVEARSKLSKDVPERPVVEPEIVREKPPTLALPAPKSPKTVQGPEGVSTEFGVPGVGKTEYKTAGDGPQFTATDGTLSRPVNAPETFRRPKGALSSDVPEPKAAPKPPTPQTREDYIKELYLLRSKIDTKVKFKPGEMKEAQGDDAVILTGYRKKINEVLDGMEEAGPLRNKDKEFSEVMALHDKLQSKFADIEAGKSTILDQVRFSGKTGSRPKINATELEPTLEQVNALAGEDVVSPVKDDMTKALINEAEANPSGDFGIRQILKIFGLNPQNAAKGVGAVSKLSNKLSPGLDRVGKDLTNATPQTLAASLMDRDSKSKRMRKDR